MNLKINNIDFQVVLSNYSIQKWISLILIFHFSLFTFHSAQAQELEIYQNRALEHNPSIQALRSSVGIAEEKINETNTLPDTEFGLGYFVSEPETRTGAQKLRLSVRQMIPWFGTIQSRRDYAGSMVNVEEINLEIARRKLNLEVSQVYFQLYELQEKKEVLQQNIDLLEVYRTMALNSVEVGKASAVEVLRLKMRQNELIEKMRNLQLQIESLETQFSNLLNSEEKLEIKVQDTLVIPFEESIDGNLSLHPELQRYDRFSESILRSEELNQLESSPKFGVGLDYVSVQERLDMMIPDNGKDIIMPMVSFSVPIFNKKFKSVSRQNDLRLEQIDSERASTLNDLESRLQTTLNERSSARISFETQLENLSQAGDAEDLLLKQYETGTIDFDDVLDIQEIQLKIQMNLVEAVRTWFTKNAIVQYLTVNN
ncbi:TolC family protein [Christiangramia echinicola]|uniref:Outer membrane protein TolC n=1 Tax=Christiangramia echinicola TaxID=279359 RepID=A0A1H1NV50_9FLAO|nr:TolC family protein [Christiangramia echinicola]SDS02690.1 Outer membrane protein TolC [Christiangramia echinicola]